MVTTLAVIIGDHVRDKRKDSFAEHIQSIPQMDRMHPESKDIVDISLPFWWALSDIEIQLLGPEAHSIIPYPLKMRHSHIDS